MSEFTRSWAEFSPCQLYRYTLERWWSPFARGRFACFCMLNPSTATATESDPTVTRCIGFAQGWGYDGLIVTNIFALRSTDPRKLKQVDDPVGPENDKYILEVAKRASLVICAWGNYGRYKNRGSQVEEMLRLAGIKPYCLGMTHAFRTKAEPPMPRHPLYLSRTRMPEEFNG